MKRIYIAIISNFCKGDNIIDENRETLEQRLKVIIVGDPGAGKRDVAKGTDICVPFKSLGVSIGKKVNMDKKINYKLTLIFWTLTKGRPRPTTYFNGAGAAIIVGKLNSKNSIKKMRDWAETIFQDIGDIPIFFIGTKINSRTKENRKKLAALANEYNTHFYILKPTQENNLKPIYKSIAKRIAKYYGEFFANSQTIIT
jgi:hypothetical protein